MIEKNYNESLLKKEPSAVQLVKMFFEIDSQENIGQSSIYHQFPFYRDTTGDNFVMANILFSSQNYGILIFQCINDSRTISNKEYLTSHLDNLQILDTLIFSRLIKSDILKSSRRNLKFAITPVLFIPEPQHNFTSDFQFINNIQDLKYLLKENKLKGELNINEFNELKAQLEGSKVIPRKNNRSLRNNSDFEHSKGAILSKIETEIAIFDSEQKKAALFTLDNPQRIRGLAGSGKTIILAMKAALIHLQDPNAHVLYTYFTKALNDYVKRLITRFYRMYCEKDPDWEKIHIMHAWGGAGLQGVYYNAAKLNSASAINFRVAKSNNGSEPFEYVCSELIKLELKIQYDYCLMDEAQDFPKSFYRLCRKITNKNRVIWAYDDFQNILDVNIQNEKETFGKDSKGEYYIDFSKKNDELQDIILHKCYRNPRKNLITAFSLGLGIYNANGKVLQRLENNDHWKSLGFTVEKGNSETGDEMIISRSVENSPLIKTELLENDIFDIKSFENISDEISSVVKAIVSDISQELLPEDIAVVCLDSKNIRTYFNAIENQLITQQIKSFSLIDAPNDNIIYKVPGHVTLSTIYKAKGNESGSVYIIGIDAVFENKDSIRERNKLFTAITRSEGWVTMSGVGKIVDICIKEYEELKKADFKLIFKQPSKESTRTIYQEIFKQQEKLNQIERIAEDLRNLGLTEEDIKEKLLNLVFKKK